ncbi:MAG: M20/M25/M40 family metallo-hydrolase, partial [Candidatus Zixiibacteriota bacterium]
MKVLTLSVVLVITLMATGYAQPVLITVELNTTAQIKEWVSIGHPTFLFAQQTAIAEIDDTQIQRLLNKGFSVEVIDESPWSENYFIGSVYDPAIQLPGVVIWQKETTRLVKSATAQVSEFLYLGLKFRLMKKHTLSERFWDNLTTKKVPLRELEYDPFIQSLVDQVSTDSITSYVQNLQDFQTRLVFSDSGFAASEWIRQKFNSFGYIAEFDSFYIDSSPYWYWPDTGYERNVIARIQGTVNPERIFIISGHQDAIIWPDTQTSWISAPGADDNASGVAATLEAARILRSHSWKTSIEFATWAAEEIGALGSEHYASRADSLNLDIGGVVNLDMIGWTPYGTTYFCDIYRTHDFCLWLSDLLYRIGQIYTPEIFYYGESWVGHSDDRSFTAHGFPAITANERGNNPHLHRPTDLMSTMTPEMYTAITKTGVATIAILSYFPLPVKDVEVADIGNGNSLQVSWTADTEPDIVGYRIYWGFESEIYTDSQFAPGASTIVDTITALYSDSTYHITVRALDVLNRLSYLATEITGIPRLQPAIPTGVTAVPIASGIEINWFENHELDFTGYRLYRRINDNPVYDSLNTALLTDTTYTDYPLSGANRYYYAVRAFDQSGYYSDLSAEAYGRPITLDQGVLVVDETHNSTNPPDSLQDAFYTFILDNYYADVYEYDSNQHAPVLADFVPYSSIVWFADDYLVNFASDHADDFRTYLDLGGNIWFAGWRPTVNLEGEFAYPFSFGSGDFMYDYFRVSNVAITAVTDSFQGADGLLSYPNLDVDP